MKKILIALLAAVMLAAAGAAALYMVGDTLAGVCYVQIDNSKIKENQVGPGLFHPNGTEPWLYTLTAYDEDGEQRKVTFGASRKLTNGAFLRLEVAPLRGVLRWIEVSFEAMPEAVREKYGG